MRKDFITLALSIKRQLEERFDKGFLKGFYLYDTLPKLMEEWKQPELTHEKTDIGIAGIMFFDSNNTEDKRLSDDIAEFSWLYQMRRKDELFPARKGSK